jgi:putative membrane protein
MDDTDTSDAVRSERRISVEVRDRALFVWVGVISISVLGFLVWLIYVRDARIDGDGALAALPSLNAALNGLCTVCLVSGFMAIRKGAKRLHIGMMVSALALSALFLVSYTVYHSVQGDTKFMGVGWVRPVYFGILISHIAFTVVMLPTVLTTLFYALSRRFATHKRIARFALPVWLYVSVTGVAIYFLLKNYG